MDLVPEQYTLIGHVDSFVAAVKHNLYLAINVLDGFSTGC